MHTPPPASDPAPELTPSESATAITLPSTDVAGRLVDLQYHLDGEVAYIPGPVRADGAWDVLHGDSYGTGVLIADAHTKGATTVVLDLGGADDIVALDAGMGILVALGAAPYDARGFALPKGGAPLVALDQVDTAQLNIPAAALNWVLVVDPDSAPTPAAAPSAASAASASLELSAEHTALLTGAMLRAAEVFHSDPHAEFGGAGGGVPMALTWLSTLLHGDGSRVSIRPVPPARPA